MKNYNNIRKTITDIQFLSKTILFDQRGREHVQVSGSPGEGEWCEGGRDLRSGGGPDQVHPVGHTEPITRVGSVKGPALGELTAAQIVGVVIERRV